MHIRVSWQQAQISESHNTVSAPQEKLNGRSDLSDFIIETEVLFTHLACTCCPVSNTI